jgi:AmmeMemoRadiSam system protein B
MRRSIAIGFYPGDKNRLESVVSDFLVSAKSGKIIKKPLGIIAPHAGYEFSGSVAGAVYASKTEKKNFFIFGPNHTGYGTNVAGSIDLWSTPLGEIKTNKEFIKKAEIEVDEIVHKYEHSIEVQLPFLQVLYKNFNFVPICLQHIDLNDIKEIAKRVTDSNSFYIASSDFMHFGPNYGYAPFSGKIQEQLKWVKERDNEMIELICKIKPEEFYESILGNGYTICGFVPITLLLFVMKNTGAKKGTLVAYKTSYDVYPNSSFVSYAGIVFD